MASTDTQFLALPVDAYALTVADTLRFQEEHELGMALPSAALLSYPAAFVPADAIGLDTTQDIIRRLRAAANGQRANKDDNGPKRTLVGLAAPQIGEPYRIILVDTTITEDRKQHGKLTCFINPEIIWRSTETTEGREGCFSAGPVWGLVERPMAIKIRAFNSQGDTVTSIFEGFSARIIAHEIDHLEGIRFPDRIHDDTKRHWVHTEELPNYPAHIHEWPRVCTLERWEAFKRGDTL
jgi:peptide deformylase